MPETDTSPAYNPEHAPEEETERAQRRSWRRFFSFWYALLYLFLVSIVLMAVLPPLLNVNRFKRKIVTSISNSLGRPVHLDNVSLVLLPFPGFKLDNFVVAEDPAFGSEPVIHANSVQATLRLSSLWTRKVEFSKIALQEPSINLVRSASGAWNVQSILLKAARIPTAPTAQAKAGPDPRFPYIEATEARVNVKFGEEKLPLSLTEADVALWLPKPQQWRVRIAGKPTRTDTSASDTGTISVEGTLGSAESFNLIPLDLSGEWKNAPLGEASRVLTGKDMGLRGDLRLNVSAHGTVGNSLVKTIVQLKGARMAEFVPPQALDLRAECQAKAAETFHAFHEIRCSWPPPGEPTLLALTGEILDIRKPDATAFELGTPGLPASVLLNWLRVASPRVSPDTIATGNLTGNILREPLNQGFSGSLTLKGAGIAGGPIGETPVTLGDVTFASPASAEVTASPSRKDRGHRRIAAVTASPDGEFVMAPATLSLGGKDPAMLDGHFDRNGYSLHLTGNVMASRLLALAAAVPQFGDGIAAVLPLQTQPPPAGKEQPIHIDLTSSRVWDGGQSWTKTAAKPAKTLAHKPRP